MSLVLRYSARSDVGLVRKGNEDSGYAGPHLLIVADGMGGHAAGELASATAVATLAELEDSRPSADDVLPHLTSAVMAAGASIGQVVQDNPEFAGMGTTVTALYWQGERLAIVHVGDSRAYLLRDDELTQITHDHTYVQTLVDAGRITSDEAAVHPRRSLLMRAIDGVQPVEADLSVREARVGDRYLLCSDGLSGVVSDEEIAAILAEGEPTGTVIALVELALARGAPDNVTVVVADVLEREDDSWGTDPVVVGAAGEPRVRARLPRVHFPVDGQRDPDRPDPPPPADGGPPTSEIPLVDADIVVPAAQKRLLSPRAKRALRITAVTGLVLVVGLAALGVLGVAWWRTQWYVGLSGSNVAIYQGVPGTIAGMPLNTMVSDSGLDVTRLPTFDAELVTRGIVADSEQDARRIVGDLNARAARCGQPRPPLGCPETVPLTPAPAPSATPSPSPSPAPTQTFPTVPIVTPTPEAFA